MSFDFKNFYIAAFPPTKNNDFRVSDEVFDELLMLKGDAILRETIVPKNGGDNIYVALYKYMDGVHEAPGDRFYHNNDRTESIGRRGVVYRCVIKSLNAPLPTICRDWIEVDVLQRHGK